MSVDEREREKGKMSDRVVRVLSMSLVLTATAAPAPAVTPAVSSGPGAFGVALDENSLWRTSEVFRHPSVRTADGKLERKQITWYWGALRGEPVASPASGRLPPSDWAGAEFDDSAWPRFRLPAVTGVWGGHFNYDTGLVVLRAQFEVKDPSQVTALKVSLAYYGGVVVYLNGQEVARGSLPGDKPGLETLAEDYPVEAVTTPEGKALRGRDEKNKDRLALRERRLADVQVPVAALRKGPNVLAIEVHAAPVPEVALKLGDTHAGWPPIGLLSVRLAASPAASITPNVARPEGLRIWNCQPWETVSAFDYGSPTEPLRPIAVAAVRNGLFSGRLMVGSNQPIKGLKVTVTDLVQGEKGEKISASAVRLRCAQPITPALGGGANWVPRDRYDGLADPIPTDVPVNANKPAPPAGRNWPPGALAPIWLTVRVPRDAKSGKYEGAVTVQADGLPATTVPLRVTVYDWALPDPKDFRTSVCGYSLPETLAGFYNVPLWSDRHFELMGQPLALMAELNSRQVLVNLSIDWYGPGGNRQSEVRWIREADGSYRHDFSVFDKHLEVIAKSIGKPRPLRLNCWVGNHLPFKNWADPQTLRDFGGYVTTLDPATGKLDQMAQPCPGSPESLAFWKPVLDEIRKKVEARGWFDATCVGHSNAYGGLVPDVVDNYRKIWPDGVWARTGHASGLGGGLDGTDPKLAPMPIRFSEGVWVIRGATVRGYRALLDPKRAQCLWYGGRHGPLSTTPLNEVRWIQEKHALEQCDGTQLGADIFPRRGDKGGYYFEAHNRGNLGPMAAGTIAILAPGPDGPIPTERFEVFREGQEITEAVLFLQRAVDAKKLGPDLEQRVNLCLNTRGEAMVRDWFGYTDSMEQDERILSLAGEVAATLQDAK